MASLLSLPKEVRDMIWQYAVVNITQHGFTWSSYGDLQAQKQVTRRGQHLHNGAILQVCRRILQETSPILYSKICLSMSHTNEILRWIQTIGPRNSACIRHLFLRFDRLLHKSKLDSMLEDRNSAWRAALSCMPNLVCLAYYLQPLPTNPRVFADEYDYSEDTVILETLAESAKAWASITDRPAYLDAYYTSHYFPTRSLGENVVVVNHALIAIDEEAPPPLVRYFGMLLDRENAVTFDPIVTGLSEDFFEEQGLQLVSSYALTAKIGTPTILLTYHKLPRRPVVPSATEIAMALQDLPIRYLRIGCRHIDANEMSSVPSKADRLETLDVSFTDDDPHRVVNYLEAVKTRCPELYTFGIHVSPLHDKQPDDGDNEGLFNRAAVREGVAEKWQPFWVQLDKFPLRVRIWEGEGPGFLRKRGLGNAQEHPL